jgi:hypothetical protein
MVVVITKRLVRHGATKFNSGLHRHCSPSILSLAHPSIKLASGYSRSTQSHSGSRIQDPLVRAYPQVSYCTWFRRKGRPGSVLADFNQLQSLAEITKQELSLDLARTEWGLKGTLTLRQHCDERCSWQGQATQSTGENDWNKTMSASHMSAASAPDNLPSVNRSQKCIYKIPLQDFPRYFLSTLASSIGLFYSLLSFCYWLAFIIKTSF